MQNFTYHTHNNNFGFFDGRNSADEMISKAEELGFKTIGVSNHLIWHPNFKEDGKNMAFSDLDNAIEMHKRNIDYIREVASKHKIRVLVGAEADFFQSAEWRKGFERMLKELDYDYLIGTNHYIKSQDENFLCNLYHIKYLPSDFPFEQLQEAIKQHWLNIVASIQSGYYDFMAHLDYCTIKIPDKSEYDDYKWQIIEALDKCKQPFEVNTSGFNRIDMQHPCDWMLEELCKRGVPTLISDDAHCVNDIGQYFIRAEYLLTSFGCKARFSME